VRVALVHSDDPDYLSLGFADAWRSALEEQGCEVQRLGHAPARWAIEGVPRFDLAISHVLVEEVVAFAPTLRVASALEATGTPLLNPVAAIVASSDKLLTHAIWASHGLSQPATYDLEALTAWPAPAAGRPLVLKPAYCDGARHIALVRSLGEAREHVAAWREDEARGGEVRGAALLQEWIEDPVCVRLFASPEQCSLAYEKHRDPDALVTSGTVYPKVYEAPPEMARLAQSMVAALGGGLMGVDILADDDGRLLALEANAPFGFDVTDPEQGRFVARAAIERCVSQQTGLVPLA
jgi:glutathione synthase/RimK-type ligase-like ATP-grasp enzyme